MTDHPSIGKFLNLRGLEPYIGLALACHGVLMLWQLGGKAEHWVILVVVAIISSLAFFKPFKCHKATQARAILYTVITAVLILSSGGSKSFFLLWYFVIIVYYPLVLGTTCGLFLVTFISLFYLSTLFLPASGEVPASVILARTTLLTFIGLLSYNLSYRLKAFDKVEVLANTDSLTGLKNRRYFFELADIEFGKARRYKTGLCMIIADINKFKEVNDTYGHATGDEALELCAKLLTTDIRESDIVCRLGGDEFAVLLTNTDKNQADTTIQRYKSLFENNLLETPRGSIQIKMSFGVAEIDGHTADLTALYKEADLSMYRNKTS